MGLHSVEWRMQCAVNDQNFEFSGVGHGDAERGEVQLELTSSGFPEGFDPVSCPLICNAPASIGFARNTDGLDTLLQACDGELSVDPARVGVIYDARGAELLRLNVSSVATVRGETLVVGNQMQGFSHLPPLERTLAPVDEFIIPTGPGTAISSIRFNLLTKSGEILTGMTMVPYRWAGGRTLEAALVRHYESVEVLWDGARAVRTTIRSSLAHLGDALQAPALSAEAIKQAYA